jgi:hypothetical protein
MGKIMSGILSPVSGKVSGVVGAKWKQTAYLRGWVKPANPNSDLQKAQRALMRLCVEFGKNLVGNIFNVYTDRLTKDMSGFNFFVKRNIKHFTPTPKYSDVKITEGKLFAGNVVSAEYFTEVGTVTITMTESLGNNGKVDDILDAVLYDKSTGFFYFPSEPAARETTLIGIDADPGLTVSNLMVFVFYAASYHDMITMISNSLWYQVTAPA